MIPHQHHMCPNDPQLLTSLSRLIQAPNCVPKILELRQFYHHNHHSNDPSSPPNISHLTSKTSFNDPYLLTITTTACIPMIHISRKLLATCIPLTIFTYNFVPMILSLWQFLANYHQNHLYPNDPSPLTLPSQLSPPTTCVPLCAATMKRSATKLCSDRWEQS